MASSKRRYSGMERELARTLTIACETAKSEIVGFQWLTHEVDYEHFPHSLKVTWMFDTEANKTQALASAQQARMLKLTQEAFEDIGISVTNIAAHVVFGAEQRQPSQSRGKRGQGH